MNAGGWHLNFSLYLYSYTSNDDVLSHFYEKLDLTMDQIICLCMMIGLNKDIKYPKLNSNYYNFLSHPSYQARFLLEMLT